MSPLEKLKDPEFREALPYFVIGALQGFIKYYIRNQKP